MALHLKGTIDMDITKIGEQIVALSASNENLKLIHNTSIIECETADRDWRESAEGQAAEKINQRLDNAIFSLKETIAELAMIGEEYEQFESYKGNTRGTAW